MQEYLSASANRAVEAAERWASDLAASQVDPLHLLLAIAEQEESRGASVLASSGLTLQNLRAQLAVAPERPAHNAPMALTVPTSPAVRQVLSRARGRSVERGADDPAGTDILLLELLRVVEFRRLLSSHGVNPEALHRQLELEADSQPLRPEFPSLELSDPTDIPLPCPPAPERDDGKMGGLNVDVYRILDACANRAREGLRVLEDFARFARDDSFIAQELKTIRHQLRHELGRLPWPDLLASRDAEHDVGTTYSAAGEWARADALDVVAANFKRAQEALRSLEEFGKLGSMSLAESIEALRYRLYTLERAVLLGIESQTRLDGVVLYLLVSSGRCRAGVDWTVREALAGGAQVIQLREKSLPDRDAMAIAHMVRRATRDADALFVVNDRPDIARLADADGVHVGQEELSVKDARRIVGPHALVGVSTHSIEQARQAVLDGANYIGVGPTFPSSTKSFDVFPGLALIQQVRAEIRLPAFAIGGIDQDRIDDVIAAGARRVAVSSAVCGAEDPRAAAADLRRRLDQPRQLTDSPAGH